MELIEQLLTNGNELTFSVLFVVILGYVIKTNDKELPKIYGHNLIHSYLILVLVIMPHF